MSIIQNSLLATSATIPASDSSWTSVKIQRVFEYSLAAGCVVGACLATATPPAAILLGIAAMGLGGHAYSLIDYQDPIVLQALREEATSLSFTDLLGKHGWKNLFRYTILTSDEFDLAYRRHADELSFKQILDLDTAARQGLRKAMSHYLLYQPHFEIPHPANWQQKFLRDTRDLSCEQILDLYPLAKLKEHKLISYEQSRILDKAKAAKQTLDQSSNALEQQYRDEISSYCIACDVAKSLAEANYLSHPAHDRIREINLLETAALSNLSQRIQNQIKREKKTYDRWFEAYDAQPPLSAEKERTIAHQKIQMETICERLRRSEEPERREIETHSERARSSHQKALNKAFAQKTLTIGAAELILDLACKPIRKKIDDLKLDLRVDYECTVRLLTQKYHRQGAHL